MEKIVRRFKTREEADAADREYWRQMTPDQRIRILLEMLSWKDGADESSPRLERIARVVRIQRR